jgi:hypothetical protein
MAMRVRTADFKGVAQKGATARRRIMSMLTLTVREDTKPYVPYVTGALRRSAELASVPDAGRLVYDMPYARAQYYGLPNKTWPGTTMQWFEASLAANRQRWEQICQQEMMRL